VECEEGGCYKAKAGDGVIPAKVRAEVEGDKDTENCQRDDFLNHFQLDWSEAAVAKTIGGDLKAILEEGDGPADEDDLPQRLALIF